ncbi:hypothetical protein PG993_003707 [Apiospora rasikravindrae]|uniref:NACHT domain-containing protein n=1 Tax=Apiospora rasikravindrae TaxID=990691 RepID=A0ABR1U0B6_9PEZI
MSHALSHAAKLKAEIRLAQAVSEFEAGLQEDAKRQFSLLKNQTISSPPTIKSVLQLTAEIDQSTRTVGSRCYGPRLIKTLECVQQFAAIGDVIIGGSQNIVACGVWTIVRTTLLSNQATVKLQSYFESLSEVFLSVGKSSPRYTEMVALQPKSQALHGLMSEYFIVVVNLCHYMYMFCMKSKLGQLKVVIGKPDIVGYQKTLEKWAAAIREQFSLEEARENSNSRKILRRLDAVEQHRQMITIKQKLLESCSRFNYQAGWKLARNAGSTSWFSETTTYKYWKGVTFGSSALLVAGKLGSGKTVLLANMVEDILLGSKGSTVAFFFCRPDDVDSLQSSTILGSLARQLVEAIPLDILQDSASATLAASFSSQDMAEVLRTLLPLLPRVYFIIDGLDGVLLFSVIRELWTVQGGGLLSVCISYRLEAERQLEEEVRTFGNCAVLSMPEENKDIHEFIQTRLETILESGTLSIGDPTLILQIQDALQKGARGMFLWVTLQIDSICSRRTDESIRAALDDLPEDLPTTYRRILQQRRNLAPEYQERVLKLMLVAMRPLSLDELREAISVVPLQTTWVPKRLVNNTRAVLSCCGSLLVIDEEQLTAHFIHPSVQQFLLSGREDPNDFHFSREAAELNMARVVLTYLNYNVFQKQVSTLKVPSVPARDVPARIMAASLGNSERIRALALQMLRKRRQGNLDIGQKLSGYSGQFQNQSQQQFYFYNYAHNHWLQHTRFLSPDNRPELDLLRRVLTPSMRFTPNERERWLSGNTPDLYTSSESFLTLEDL